MGGRMMREKFEGLHDELCKGEYQIEALLGEIELRESRARLERETNMAGLVRIE
jgi:hypothetical protein